MKNYLLFKKEYIKKIFNFFVFIKKMLFIILVKSIFSLLNININKKTIFNFEYYNKSLNEINFYNKLLFLLNYKNNNKAKNIKNFNYNYNYVWNILVKFNKEYKECSIILAKTRYKISKINSDFKSFEKTRKFIYEVYNRSIVSYCDALKSKNKNVNNVKNLDILWNNIKYTYINYNESLKICKENRKLYLKCSEKFNNIKKIIHSNNIEKLNLFYKNNKNLFLMLNENNNNNIYKSLVKIKNNIIKLISDFQTINDVSEAFLSEIKNNYKIKNNSINNTIFAKQINKPPLHRRIFSREVNAFLNKNSNVSRDILTKFNLLNELNKYERDRKMCINNTIKNINYYHKNKKLYGQIIFGEYRKYNNLNFENKFSENYNDKIFLLHKNVKNSYQNILDIHNIISKNHKNIKYNYYNLSKIENKINNEIKAYKQNDSMKINNLNDNIKKSVHLMQKNKLIDKLQRVKRHKKILNDLLWSIQRINIFLNSEKDFYYKHILQHIYE